MRALFTILGIASISVYAVLGALLINDWAVVAASELPLDETIDAMKAANQPYNIDAGIGFAGIGILLAFAWGVLTLHPQFALPVWASISSWAGIVALRAPAFFFASFSNMNSVGDTFYDWNAEAAFALEQPLYAASGVAALIAAGVGATMFITTLARQSPSRA